MKAIMLRLPESDLRVLKRLAKVRRSTVSQLIRQAVGEMLNGRRDKEKEK